MYEVYKLIHEKTGEQTIKGEVLTDFRGEKAILRDYRPPHKPSSTERVIVEIDGKIYEYYPGVYGLKIITVQLHL